MRCEESRLELWPKPGPRATSAESAEALAHYAACVACQQFFRTEADLSARLRRLAATPAPARLRARILATLDAESVTATARRRARWFAGTGAVLLAAAAAIALLVGPGPEPATIASPLVQHARVPLDEAQSITSSNVDDVERWFAETMGHPVAVLNITDAYLVGGRVATLDGSRAAVVVYLYHGMPLTYFALPTNDVMGVPVRGDQVMATSVDGYEVALWTEDGKARAVVAPMPRAEVMDVAKECRDKALIRVS